MNTVAWKGEKIYVGMDVSQKTIEIFCLRGEQTASGARIDNSREAIESFLNVFPEPGKVCVVMETGTHSAWMSRWIEKLGFEVLVAYARDLALIYRSDRKTDRIDAERLARLAQADRKLLHPIKHMSAERQCDLTVLKARDLLVRERTGIVNCIRGQLRAMGYCDDAFTVENMKNAGQQLPVPIRKLFAPMFQTLAALSLSIKSYDRQIDALGKKYPATATLRQITGVGPQIALAFVLLVGEVNRFPSMRKLGAYFGLVPKQDQSGETDRQLGISKNGNSLMRRLLIQGAQYIMGPHGPECDLRRFGERIAARGGAIAKRKARVAVARKLSTVMLALWTHPDVPYDVNYRRKHRGNQPAA